MPDFSSTYYSLKRSALAFLAIVIVLGLPGVTPGQATFGGITINDIAFGWLLLLLYVAAIYYVVSFGLVWWVEGRGKLIALEQSGSGELQLALNNALAQHQDVAGQLQTYVSDHLRWSQSTTTVGLLKRLDSVEGREAVSREVAVHIGRVNVGDVEAIERGAQKAVSEYLARSLHDWPPLVRTFTELTERLDQADYVTSLQRVEVALKGLSSKLQTLHSVRRFKFLVMDAGAVAVAAALASIMIFSRLLPVLVDAVQQVI